LERRKFPYGLEPGDGIQVGLNSGEAALLYGRLVHTCGIKVTDLLSHGIPTLFGRSRFFQNAPQEIQVVLVELAVDIPSGLIEWDGILLLPSAARVVIEIHAGINGSVH
jgi:hypothetical protein